MSASARMVDRVGPFAKAQGKLEQYKKSRRQALLAWSDSAFREREPTRGNRRFPFVNSGESGGNSYFLFHFPVELQEKMYIRGSGATRRCIREVTIIERNSPIGQIYSGVR